jgi:hypothetical protein
VAGLFANGIDPAAVNACEAVANVLEGVSIKRAHR